MSGLARRLHTGTLLARVSLFYALFAALKHITPATTLARWAWRDSPPASGDAVNRAVAGLVAIRRWRATSGDCLESSLVLYRELSRAGARPDLVMGFSRADGRVEGHAWVELNGMPVAEDADVLSRFVETARFGQFGRPASSPIRPRG